MTYLVHPTYINICYYITNELMQIMVGHNHGSVSILSVANACTSGTHQESDGTFA